MAATNQDEITLAWMKTVFSDKQETKVASWLNTLQGEELSALSDLRSLSDADWGELSLPLAVRKRLQIAASEAKSDKIQNSFVDSRKLTQIDCIVMDISASMKARSAIDKDKTREDVSKILFLTLVDKLIGMEMPHSVGLLAFGERVLPIGEFTRDFSSFQDELGRLDANESCTKLYDAILDASNMIDNYASQHKSEMDDDCVKRIFVLTDGVDNASKTSAWELAHSLQTRSFVLDAIPVAGPNKILQAVSVASKGLALCVSSEAQAMELFENEALLALCRREVGEEPPKIKCAADLRNLCSQDTVEQKEEIVVAVPSQVKGRTVSGKAAVEKVEDAIKSKKKGNSGSLVRLMKELKDLECHPPSCCSAGMSESDPFHWNATILGPENTDYEGGTFTLYLQFPADYPFKPPKVRFVTKVFHVNVNSTGAICLDILKDRWSPALSVSKILLCIQSLLSHPNPDDPLDAYKAQLYLQETEKYHQTAKEWTKKYAM